MKKTSTASSVSLYIKRQIFKSTVITTQRDINFSEMLIFTQTATPSHELNDHNEEYYKIYTY